MKIKNNNNIQPSPIKIQPSPKNEVQNEQIIGNKKIDQQKFENESQTRIEEFEETEMERKEEVEDQKELVENENEVNKNIDDDDDELFQESSDEDDDDVDSEDKEVFEEDKIEEVEGEKSFFHQSKKIMVEPEKLNNENTGFLSSNLFDTEEEENDDEENVEGVFLFGNDESEHQKTLSTFSKNVETGIEEQQKQYTNLSGIFDFYKQEEDQKNGSNFIPKLQNNSNQNSNQNSNHIHFPIQNQQNNFPSNQLFQNSIGNKNNNQIMYQKMQPIQNMSSFFNQPIQNQLFNQTQENQLNERKGIKIQQGKIIQRPRNFGNDHQYKPFQSNSSLETGTSPFFFHLNLWQDKNKKKQEQTTQNKQNKPFFDFSDK